jgi:hypothetical protein
MHINQPAQVGTLQDTGLQVGLKDLWEEGEDIEAHGLSYTGILFDHHFRRKGEDWQVVGTAS